jgi:hypothetical protein
MNPKTNRPKRAERQAAAENAVKSLKARRIVGCKHRQSWIIGNGSYEWCYQCGAFRGLKQQGPRENMLAPCSPWVHPTGIGGENPHDKWIKAKERWDRDHNLR